MLKLNSKGGKNYHSTYTTPMAKTYTAGRSEQSLLFSFICVTSIRLKLRFLNMQEIYMLLTSQIWNLWSYLFSSLLNNTGLSWCLAQFWKVKQGSLIFWWFPNIHLVTKFYLKLKWYLWNLFIFQSHVVNIHKSDLLYPNINYVRSNSN